MNSNNNQVYTYHYDTAGRLDWIDNFNATITGYGYDTANRLTSMINKKSDNTVLSSCNFTLDGNGNRRQEIRQEPIPPSGLKTENVAFNYNAQRNRLQTAGSDTFAFDDEGQLANKSGTAYTFDYAHRLVGIGAGTQFYYDGAGNRLKVTRSGVTTKYIYDASGNLLAEADGAGNITKYYIHGAGLLAMVTSTGQVYCYHYDATGNTIAMTDSTQTMVNKYAYTPYGRIVNAQESVQQPFKFVGQYGVMTEDNGFYYMRARYYDPTVGRFISEDPSGFDGGDVNLYAYVGGNPVMFVDPWGLEITIYNSTLLEAGATLAGTGSLIIVKGVPALVTLGPTGVVGAVAVTAVGGFMLATGTYVANYGATGKDPFNFFTSPNSTQQAPVLTGTPQLTQTPNLMKSSGLEQSVNPFTKQF